MTENPWLNQPDVDPYPMTLADAGVAAAWANLWASRVPPSARTTATEVADFERESADRYMEEIGANRPAAERRERALRLAEGAPRIHWRDMLARAWDEGWSAGWDEAAAFAGPDATRGDATNPYRSQAPSEATTAPQEPAQPASDHRDTPEPTEPTGGAQ